MKIISVIYIGLICLLIFLADNGALPQLFDRYRSIPFGDQVGHFFLIGILTLALNVLFSFKQISVYKFKPFLGCMIIFFLITLEESSQIFLTHRSFSFADMLANYLGILFFGHFLSRILLKQRRTCATKENFEG